MRKSASTLESEIQEDEMTSLLKTLRDKELNGTHLEIGTAAGGTLCILTSFYLEHSESRPSFMVVDPFNYFPSQFEIVCKNLRSHGMDPQSIEFLKTTSKEAFSHIKSNPPELEFILIDGNHKVRHVTQDLRWARFLKPGGILCAHDYCPSHPGVYLSIKRFLGKHSNYEIKSCVGSLLIVQKNGISTSNEVSFFDCLRANILAPWFQLKASFVKRVKKWRQ
jgi:predicted O-methyltransferase YrrM